MEAKVFGHMFDVLAWGVALSLLAIAVAFLGDGRGSHVLKVLLGLTRAPRSLDVYESLPRDDSDWQVLARLAEADGPRREHASVASAGAEAR